MENVLVISHEWNLGFDELRELADAGFQVVPATNGFEAVKIFATRAVAAVIVNRRLPDINVADLVSYFRHHNDSMPIVMLSAVMPVLNVPPAVDAVLSKRDCATLLCRSLQHGSSHPIDMVERKSVAHVA